MTYVNVHMDYVRVRTYVRISVIQATPRPIARYVLPLIVNTCLGRLILVVVVEVGA